MAGTLRVGGKVLATHDSGTDEISLDSATNTSNMSFDANHAGIKTALNASGDAPVYACRAWVNFDGTGTVAIRGSGNVSSITDNGTGKYTVNLATAMPDANFSIVSHTHGDISNAGDFNRSVNGYPISNTAFYLNSYAPSNTSLIDTEYVSAAIFR